MSTQIETKYQQLGGAQGFLGQPLGTEQAAGNGQYRQYQGGTIYWSSATGAHEVHGGFWRTTNNLVRL